MILFVHIERFSGIPYVASFFLAVLIIMFTLSSLLWYEVTALESDPQH